MAFPATTVILTVGESNPNNVRLLPGGPLTQQNGLFFNPTLPLSQTTSINAQRLGSPLTLLSTPPVAIPVGTNYDFPNPTVLPSRIAAITAQPLGSPRILLSFPAAPIPVGTFRDWQNPTLRVSSLVAYATGPPLGGVPLTLLPQPAGNTDVPRANIYGLTFVKRTGAELSQPLGTPKTLTQPTAQPFQNIWENPALPIDRRVAVTSQPLGIGRTLILPAPPPPNQYDWPNPTLPPDRRVAVSSQPLGTPRATLLPAPVLPLNQYDWPNPVLPTDRRVAVSSQPLGIGRTLILPAPPPPSQQWPNPVLPIDRRVATISQPLGSFTIRLPTPTVLPFNQSNWPNPIVRFGYRASITAQPLGFTPITPVIVGVGPAPATYPRIGIPYVHPVTPLGTPIVLIPRPLPPIRNVYPNPVLARPYQQIHPNYVFIPPVINPPIRNIWPNPVLPKYRDVGFVLPTPPQPVIFKVPPEPLLVSRAIPRYPQRKAVATEMLNLRPRALYETVKVPPQIVLVKVARQTVVVKVGAAAAAKAVTKAIASVILPEDVP